jgi:hypothetical protein
VTAIGAGRPLRRIPAIVFFLNPHRAFSLVGGNHSSFPISLKRSSSKMIPQYSVSIGIDHTLTFQNLGSDQTMIALIEH